jgi:hypothetical protein
MQGQQVQQEQLAQQDRPDHQSLDQRARQVLHHLLVLLAQQVLLVQQAQLVRQVQLVQQVLPQQ